MTPDNDRYQDDPARGTRYYGGLTHAAIRRPVGTLAIASIVIVLGLFFIGKLPVNLLPQIEYPLIRVTVNYPGVATEVMEEQVTRVLERGLSSVENLSKLSARASEGRSNVSLTFEQGVDLDVALQNTARALESTRPRLPRDIDPPRLRKWDPGEWSIWRAAMSETGWSSGCCRSCNRSKAWRRWRRPAGRSERLRWCSTKTGCGRIN
jgi:multidrug efflux pump subunit AcrB